MKSNLCNFLLSVVFTYFNGSCPLLVADDSIRARNADGKDNSRPTLISRLYTIKLGENLQACRGKLGLREIPSYELLRKHPFVQTLSFVNGDSSVIWTDELPRADGWPTFIIGVFSNTNKTELVDLLEAKDGRTKPVVPGKYQQALAAVHPGMSVNELYSLVGSRNSQYYQDDNGKWRVRFTYSGYKGRIYVYEADAATGKIFRAREEGI